MNYFVYVVFVSTLLYPQTLHSILKSALRSHPSLDSIRYSVRIADEKIKKSTLWKNPTLEVGLRDILISEPFDRSVEPMQSNFISITQQIPTSDKLRVQKSIQIVKKSMLMDDLDEAKCRLVKEIKLSVYTIDEYKQRIAIVKKYIALTRENIKLYNDYIAIDSMSHTQGVQAELMLSTLKIKEQQYRAILLSQMKRLKYLAEKKISSVSLKKSFERVHSLA